MQPKHLRSNRPGRRVYAAGIAASVVIHAAVFAFAKLTVPVPGERDRVVQILPPLAAAERPAEQPELSVVRLAVEPAGGAASPTTAEPAATEPGVAVHAPHTAASGAAADRPDTAPGRAAARSQRGEIVLAAAGLTGSAPRRVTVTELESVGGGPADEATLAERAAASSNGRDRSRGGIRISIGTGDGCFITGRGPGSRFPGGRRGPARVRW